MNEMSGTPALHAIDAEAVRRMLRAEIRRAGSQPKFALKLGIADSEVCQCASGVRRPSIRILQYFGLVRIEVYAPASQPSDGR